MIAFIDDHRAAYGVEPICRVLPIAPSTYYDHVAKRADTTRQSARAKRDTALKADIRRVFADNFAVYGARKVWRQLRREGHGVARCTVERLMRAMSLQGAVRGKPVRTTISDKAAACPLDRVNRRFRASRPNMLWVSDFTYVATWQGFIYMAPPVAPPPAASQSDRQERLSSTSSPGASSAGVLTAPRTQASSSTRWSRPYTTDVQCAAVDWCTIATGGANMFR